jgi:cysteine protease ATG4
MNEGEGIPKTSLSLQNVRAHKGRAALMGAKREILQGAKLPSTLEKESLFGSEEDRMHELEDRTGRNLITHIIPAGNGPELPGGSMPAMNTATSMNTQSTMGTTTMETKLFSRVLQHCHSMSRWRRTRGRDRKPHTTTWGMATYLLGKTYDAVNDYAPRRNDEISLFLFTYRFDFPEIVPYRITTDAGWGCMLRSAQMMLAQALRMHYRGRNWIPPQALAQRRHDSFVAKLLTWFADYPSKADCIFSLHNMVAAGLAKYETLPGEWYGPSKASYVMHDLCSMYAERQAKEGLKGSGDMDLSIFRVHVASQGTVYRDAVHALMTKNQMHDKEHKASDPEPSYEPLSHPLDPIYTAADAKRPSTTSFKWDAACFCWCHFVSGFKILTEDYAIQLAHVFSFGQSVGVLGGRPRGARWFYGATSDGAKLFGLDPHTLQPCPVRRNVKLATGQTKQVVSLTAEYLRSVHTTSTECINLNRLDPSLSLGFYCRDEQDFDHLCNSLQKWKKLHPKMPDIFTVADYMPDYSANVSSAMSEMISMSLADGMDEVENDDQGDDEDDYVLL